MLLDICIRFHCHSSPKIVLYSFVIHQCSFLIHFNSIDQFFDFIFRHLSPHNISILYSTTCKYITKPTTINANSVCVSEQSENLFYFLTEIAILTEWQWFRSINYHQNDDSMNQWHISMHFFKWNIWSKIEDYS